MTRRKKENRTDRALEVLASLGGVDLRKRAEAGELRRAYGRDAQVEDVLGALNQRRGVLLLGAPGVGKTAVLHEAVHRMVRKTAPEGLWETTVVQLSCTALERGARNTGEWSQRLGSLVDAVAESRDIVVYLDDIWTLREAGRYSGNRQSFATFLLSHIESKKLVLLGESTAENYTRRGMDASPLDRGSALADDPSLMANFTIVTLQEPDTRQVRAIVKSVVESMGRTGHLQVEGAALDRVIELTRRFLVAEAFPGKAIRLLESIGRQAGTAGADEIITSSAVTDAFAALTGLPAKIFSDAVPLAPDDIRAYFTERVVGQEEAVEAVVDRVTLIKAELHEPGRPLGVLLFLGPTGSGKTYMAKTLANYVSGSEDRLVRLDMSEFKHYGSAGSLTQQLVSKLASQTFSVLLLDEVEKADPAIFDLFLQAFGDGRLTDPGSGRMVDLRNTLVVMTSNLGGTFRGQAIGFARAGQHEAAERDRVMQEVEEYFRPEFINRLDSTVVFRSLDTGNMRLIARRELGRALQREGVMRRNILLDFQEDVLDVLVEAGFSEMYGARPLKRAIDRLVLLPLARRIAADPGLHDQLLEFCAPGRRIAIEAIPLAPAESPTQEDVCVEDSTEWDELPVLSSPPLSARQIQAEREAMLTRLSGHIDSVRFRELVELKERLLTEALAPDFWDDQEYAHTVNRTVYHLDRVTSRLLNLQRHLESMPILRETQRHDPAWLLRLSSRLQTLRDRVAMAELELLATDGGSVLTTGARLYSFARSHSIRDPRTGRRSSRPRDVLNGDLDTFLVAYLSSDLER